MTDVSQVIPETSPDVILPSTITGHDESRWTFAITGKTNTILIDNLGSAWAQGANKEGQLGLSPTPEVKEWTKIEGPWGDRKLVSGSAGVSFGMLVDEDGKLYAFGSMENVSVISRSCFDSDNQPSLMTFPTYTRSTYQTISTVLCLRFYRVNLGMAEQANTSSQPERLDSVCPGNRFQSSVISRERKSSR